MSSLHNLFRKKSTKQFFQAFTDDEKRELLKYSFDLLTKLTLQRMVKGKNEVLGTDADCSRIARLSDADLDRLLQIRILMDQADAKSGPEAISLYKKVSNLAPWHEICLQSIGVEYAQAGNLEAGKRWLEKALLVNPNSESVRQNYTYITGKAPLRPTPKKTSLFKKITSIFSKPASIQTSTKSESDRFLQELAQKSPRSKCGVCGKDVRGPSGGIVHIPDNVDIVEYIGQKRWVCPTCGFISCFGCSADSKISKVICPQCGDQMGTN